MCNPNHICCSVSLLELNYNDIWKIFIPKTEGTVRVEETELISLMRNRIQVKIPKPLAFNVSLLTNPPSMHHSASVSPPDHLSVTQICVQTRSHPLSTLHQSDCSQSQSWPVLWQAGVSPSPLSSERGKLLGWESVDLFNLEPSTRRYRKESRPSLSQVCSECCQQTMSPT